LAQISNAKTQLIGPDEYAARVASFYDQTVADVYSLYQRKLFASNAVDFDDMLMLTVDVLHRFPEAREKWSKAFRYVLVDEYQDTNHAQYVFLKLIAGEHRNLMAVGDPDQCLVAGTLVTIANGSRKPIEDVVVGEELLSCYGSGRFDAASVVRTHTSDGQDGVAITLASGRRIVSTPEHTHFAGSGSLEAHPDVLDVERTHNFVANGIVTHNSIYAFRGADIRNILEFERDFPNTKVIPLEQNYRSTNAILQTANELISHNRERKEKNLWSDHGEG